MTTLIITEQCAKMLNIKQMVFGIVLQQETPIQRLMVDCELEDVICQIQSAKYCVANGRAPSETCCYASIDGYIYVYISSVRYTVCCLVFVFFYFSSGAIYSPLLN